MITKIRALAGRMLATACLLAATSAAHAACLVTGPNEITCSGNSTGSTLIGSAANDRFIFADGTTGDVTIVSGGAATRDTVDFSGFAGPVAVDLGNQAGLQAVAPGLLVWFQGFTAIELRSGAGDDALTGTAGDDVIDGGPGADTIDGAGGTDTQSNSTLAQCGIDTLTSIEVDACPYPVTSYSAPSATGSGIITASFTGGGPGCTFGTAQFINVEGDPGSPPAGTAPAGVGFPHGLFDFTTTGCTAGSTITMTITYPAALRPGTVYYKYGPTPTVPAANWYVLPAAVAGNTVVFSITDGGLGDDDLAANGTIVDQGGPGVGAAVGAPSVPTVSEWMLVLMALAMGGLAIRRARAWP